MKIDTFSGETNWKKLAGQARRAEAIGFDGFAIPEITGDPFIHAAIVCNATERIQARTAIAVAFPRSPMVVASQSWAIQVNSGGRFAVGLGTQVKGHNERRFSTPWKAPSEPDGRVRESPPCDLALLGARGTTRLSRASTTSSP